MRGGESIKILLQDLRFGVRMLLKQPGFTLITVLTLALGISINTTVFTYVNAVMFRLLTFDEPERVAFIWATNPVSGNNQEPVSSADFKEWREQAESFETMAGVTQYTSALTGTNEPERISSAAVSANYFQMLGVKPFRGRWFLPVEDQPGATGVAVLSYDLWQRRFGGDPNALGQGIILEGGSYTIIGIAPQDNAQLLIKADVWEPLILDPTQADRSKRSLMVVGRLKRGVTVTQANAEMVGIAGRIAQQHSSTNAGWSAHVKTAPDQYLNAEGKIAVGLLVAVVICVMLIACFNVACMQSARTLARRQEMAIRLALGAGRWRLIRQLLIENLLLVLFAGVMGFLTALWMMRILTGRYAATSPFLNQAKVDGSVLVIIIIISLLSAIFCGLIPIRQAIKPDLYEAVKEGGRGATGNIGHRMRSALVIAEISLSFILLIVAGLMIRSIIAIQTIEPGFDPNNLLTARLTLPQRDYPTDSRQSEFFAQLMTRIVAQPGIKSAAAIDSLPLIGGNNAPTHSLTIEGRPPEANGQSPWARVLIATPDCFTALGIPLLSGRPLLAQDAVNAPPVALINRAMAQKYWPQADPIGRRIKMDGDSQTTPTSIVGIVGDVRDDYADAPPAPRIYLPYAQNPVREMFLIIRTTDAQDSAAQALRNAVRTIDRNLPLYEVHSMHQRLFNDLSSTYLVVELLGMFALAALFLASVGLYGVIAYSVSQRTREIGIRMALGAQNSEILKLILRQGVKLTAVGLLIGSTAAFGLTWLMKRILFAVSAVDPSTFALIAILLTVVSVLACLGPARRATKVDPLTALRCD